YPAAQHFADICATQDREAGCAAAEGSYRDMAVMLAGLGVTVNCAPVVDVPAPDCHEFLSGSRTYGRTAEDVAHMGAAVCRGLLAGGITPVIKHIPGHGRARVDSHFALPVTDVDSATLAATDFHPFTYLSNSDMK